MKKVSVGLLLSLVVALAVADNYDFVVIGGGTSGSVVAKGLSDVPSYNVLVLERGRDDSSFSSTFVDFYDNLALGNPLSWAEGKDPLIEHHFSTEQGTTTLGFTSQYIPSPRTFGGGSTVNGNAYSRQTAIDFARFNNSIWTYANLLPDIKALEQCKGPICDPAHHGLNGPIVVNTFQPNPIEQAFFWAMAQAFNVSVDPDFNDGTAQGVGYLPRNIDVVNGVPIRQDSYTKVLKPVLGRPNLVVKSAAKVLRIELDRHTNRHTVVYEYDYNVYRVTPQKEVILSAGAYNDPKLLLLSGVGDCGALAAIGIQCVVNNSQVGQNLHEAGLTALVFAVSQPTGPAAQPGNIPCVYSASQWYAASGGTGTDQETAMASIAPDGSVYLAALTQDRNTFSGQLTLSNSNPNWDPIVTFNLYPQASDWLPLVDQIQRFRKAMQIVAANLSILIEEYPPSGAVPSDTASLTDYLAGGGATAEFHYVGTCSINKVVDGRLRLIDNRGNVIPGIRVASNAVVPELMSVHGTCSTAQLIGQVAQRLIKEDW